MNLIWQQPFYIRSFDVGPGGRMRVDALMGLIQEAANAHTMACHIGVRALMAQGRTWVLSRYRLQIERLPLMGETVQAHTWASGFESQFTLRDFEVIDEQGQAIARAASSWVILDLKAHAPIPPEEIVGQELIVERRSIDAPFQKMPPLDECSREIELPVQERDLDINGHVNHAVYPQWAFEAISHEMRRGLRLRDFEASYRGEALQGDAVRSRLTPLAMSDAGSSFLHQILNKASGQELTRLVSHWQVKKSA